MAAAGWTLPPQERLGVVASSWHRRVAAVEEWAVDSGAAADESGRAADWHKLEALGLV
ncbi:MAG: hypothetical protein ACR2HA_11140 [Nocardioides sp.]